MKNVRNLPLVKHYLTYRYRHHRKNIANIYLRHYESYNGKTGKKLIKQSDEYSKEVLGWSGYAPWLWLYSAVNGSFKEGWIPDDYYGRVVVPAIKGHYGKLADLKSLSTNVFNSHCFPDIAYYTNGLFLSKDYSFIPKRDIQKFLFKDGDQIVFKQDHTGMGKGVFFFTESNFELKEIQSLGNGVFQSYIDQHPYFNQFTSGSVSNIRITTVNDDKGHFSIRGCYLRMAREKETHVIANSQIRIPIRQDTGEFYDIGYTKDWEPIEHHPDSKTKFDGKRIPEFAQCVSTVLNLHKSIPQVRCIGWDVIPDKDSNIKIMEWNGTWNGIDFAEATQGPCFSGLGWENLWKSTGVK